MKFDASILPDHLNSVPDLARMIEDKGFDGLWMPETSHNPFFPLTLGAYATQRVELGTAIAVAFARSPMATAQAAWDLAAQSEGRFLLGLGTQVKAHITRRFGMEWGSPGPRLRDYILALRAIWNAWAGIEPLNYRGEFYKHTLMTPFFSPPRMPYHHIPIYIAGVNTYLCQLAGELCEGFHVHPFHTTGYLQDVIIPNVAEGAAKSGRSRADVNLTCAIFVVTGETRDDLEQDKIMVKSQIAFYASTPSYKAVLEHHGWEDLQNQLSLMARQNNWSEMHELISDEMLDQIAVVGTHDELGHKVKERYTGLLDRVAYYIPYDIGGREAMWNASLAAFNA